MSGSHNGLIKVSVFLFWLFLVLHLVFTTIWIVVIIVAYKYIIYFVSNIITSVNIIKIQACVIAVCTNITDVNRLLTASENFNSLNFFYIYIYI